MGVNIKDILEWEEMSLKHIENKKITIDSYNMLYQFVSTIRGADGNILTDYDGRVTSHLKGLFNRCVYFKKNNIKAIFVFDGKSPKLKEKEQENRRKKKQEADEKYKEALELGLADEAAKYQKIAENKLNSEMVDEAKELILAFGFPVVQAPSEGEAQGAQIVSDGGAYALSSQDFDSLLFGTKYLIRNLSISNKRKVPGSNIYRDIPIEFYDLKKNLDKLGLTREELILVAILCGTDFNIGGIKGIGPKKALNLVREYRDKPDEMFKNLKWHDYFDYTWVEVLNVFKKMPVDKNLEIDFNEINKDKIRSILTDRDFDINMIDRSLDGIKKVKTLDSFF